MEQEILRNFSLRLSMLVAALIMSSALFPFCPELDTIETLALGAITLENYLLATPYPLRLKLSSLVTAPHPLIIKV